MNKKQLIVKWIRILIQNKNLKVLGLIFLLAAWGADYFWLSKTKGNLNKIDFAVINSGLVDNNSELNFIKYISQGRNDPKLLSLSYRNKLEGIAATILLLKKSGIQPDSPDKNIMDEVNKLLEFTNKAYQNGISLEPQDINRNVRHEIVLIEQKMHRYLIKCLKESKNKYRNWDIIFISMYIIGSLCLITGEFKQKIT